MSRSRLVPACLLACVFMGLASLACQPSKETPASQPIIFLHVLSGLSELPRATEALLFAGIALDEGREVVMFLSVNGPELACRDEQAKPFVAGQRVDAAPDSAAGPAPNQMLKTLIGRGAQVYVCPHCLKTLKIAPESLLEGVTVSIKARLFHKMPNLTVFSY
jgi:predicted peroxiredoxin